jgi:SanA protein
MTMVGTTADQVYNDVNVPEKQVVLVLGAKVFKDGRLSNMMRDRADEGILLYKNHKVEKILVSGDHGTTGYDEVNTIRDYMLAKGIPAEDIFMDHAGFDTYQSVYRARAVFKVHSMIIATQQFHLPRALFFANVLKIDAVGVTADRMHYTMTSRIISNVREVPASMKAFLEAKVLHLKPHFLGDPIPITGDGRETMDKNSSRG